MILPFFVVFSKMLLQLAQICQGIGDNEKTAAKEADKGLTSEWPTIFWRSLLEDDRQQMHLPFGDSQWNGQTFDGQFGTAHTDQQHLEFGRNQRIDSVFAEHRSGQQIDFGSFVDQPSGTDQQRMDLGFRSQQRIGSAFSDHRLGTGQHNNDLGSFVDQRHGMDKQRMGLGFRDHQWNGQTSDGQSDRDGAQLGHGWPQWTNPAFINQSNTNHRHMDLRFEGNQWVDPSFADQSVVGQQNLRFGGRHWMGPTSANQSAGMAQQHINLDREIDTDQQHMHLRFGGSHWLAPSFFDQFGTSEWAQCPMPTVADQWQQQQLQDNMISSSSSSRMGQPQQQRNSDHFGGDRQSDTVYQDKQIIQPVINTVPFRMIPTPAMPQQQKEAGPSYAVVSMRPSSSKLPSSPYTATVSSEPSASTITTVTPDFATVSVRQHTVTKRPIERGEQKGQGAKHGKGKQQKVAKKSVDNQPLQKAGKREKQKMKEKQHLAKPNGPNSAKMDVDELRDVFLQTLSALDENEKTTHIYLLLIELLKKGAKREDTIITGQFEGLAQTLRQMDTAEVEQRLREVKVIKAKEGKVGELIGQIQAEEAIVFGKSHENMGEWAVSHALEQVRKMVMQPIEFTDQKVADRAKLLFFLLRLYRKMIGLIGAPYRGIDELYAVTQSAQRSDHEALLILLGMAKNEIMAYFERYLDLQAFEQHKLVLCALASFDAFDLLRESFELAHCALFHSLDPLLTGHNVFWNKFGCVLVLLEEIADKNIACLFMANVDKFAAANGADLMSEIEQSARDSTERVGHTILRIFYEAMAGQRDENGGGGQRVDKLIQSAKIYGQIYTTIGQFMGINNEAEPFFVQNGTLKNARDKLRNFLAKSVAQLDHLVTQWAELKPKSDQPKGEEIGAQFLKDFVEKHCENVTRREEERRTEEVTRPI